MAHPQKTRRSSILSSRAYVWIDRRAVHLLAADLIVLPAITFDCVANVIATISAERAAI